MHLTLSSLSMASRAARSEVSPARWRKPFLDWMDSVETGWGIPLLLIGFVVVWLAFLMIAYVGGDLHSDVLETWTLGRSIEWGYSKHPPLMGWIARAWTSVFPLTNWSFQLMALINAAIALWAVDLISRRFASGDKRVVVLLLLMLLPVYQLHAQRFNANTVLLPAWPIATYCFLRSFETRAIGWAVAAGAAAAVAMLGKYYSVFLILAFFVAAICHPQRRAYFASLAPGVSVLTMVAALGPHIHWLTTTGAKPFAYALARHTGKAFGASLIEAVLFVLGVAAVLAIPAAIFALMSVDRFKELSRDFRAMNSGLLLLLLIGAATIVLPAITSIGLGADMPPLWALQGLFLLVIPMVCGTSYRIERFYSVNLAAVVVAAALFAAAVVAPVHAYYRNSHPLHEGRNFYALAADELTRRWHEQFNPPLSAVGGDEGLAFAMAFYSPDHPLYEERLVLPFTDALPRHATFEQGWAALCYGGDAPCIASMERVAAYAPRSVNTEFVVQSSLLGEPGATQRFTALMVPPADADSVAPASSPPPPPPAPAIAAASSDIAAVLVRQDEPTCCTRRPEPDNAEPSSDLALRPGLPTNEADARRSRQVAAAAPELPMVGPNRALPPDARDGFARWPIPSPAARAKPATARGGAGARPAFLLCNGGSERHGSKHGESSAPQPLSARIESQFCSMSADLDRKLQLWRGDKVSGDKVKSSVKPRAPDAQRPRI
jgi:4-amino-4-deoxy-L-arabinose transferase-like glycosyltransferase